MALTYPGSVFGAESPSVYVEGCSVEDGYLKIYTNDNISSQEQTLSAENFTITLGDTVLPCSQAVPFSDTGEGVAYVFLVDIQVFSASRPGGPPFFVVLCLLLC